MAELLHTTSWQADGGPRVLVEAEHWSTREVMARTLRAAGYQVETCPGPSGADARCPLAASQGCAAAEEADVVVHGLHPGDERNRELVQALRRRNPGTPLVIDLTDRAVGRHPAVYAGCILVQEPGSTGSLLDAVRQATS